MQGMFKVKDIRRMLGISQKEMAKALDMSINTYTNKEKKNKFYFHEIHHLCELFQIDLRSVDAEIIED